jgi:hypothetical protein
VFARRDAPPWCCELLRPAPPFGLAAVWLLNARKLTPHPAAASETTSKQVCRNIATLPAQVSPIERDDPSFDNAR